MNKHYGNERMWYLTLKNRIIILSYSSECQNFYEKMTGFIFILRRKKTLSLSHHFLSIKIKMSLKNRHKSPFQIHCICIFYSISDWKDIQSYLLLLNSGILILFETFQIQIKISDFGDKSPMPDILSETHPSHLGPSNDQCINLDLSLDTWAREQTTLSNLGIKGRL